MEKRRSSPEMGFEKLEGMNCFVCAPERLNASGLHLIFHETADGAETIFRLPRHFQSYPGFIHGGILCTIVDETMGYVGVFKKHVLPFTRVLTTRFRQGIKADTEYRCTASLIKDRGGRLEIGGAIYSSEGETLVSAEGDFAIPTFAMIQRMMPETEVEPFRSWFRP